MAKAGQGGSDPTAPGAPLTAVLRPFRQTVFTVLWTATVVANVGSWMYNASAGWLMTLLNPDPLIVALVQVATTAPMFLFALPAGVLADVFDRRRFLIGVEVALTVLSAIFAALVSLELARPGNLLVFTFLLGAGAALAAPAWQAIVPALVAREDLTGAVAANSVGINVSRAIGPALAGVLIGAIGMASPFWVNAASNLGIIVALLWWQSPERAQAHLPAERLRSALRTGLRYARHNRHLQATLMRALGFFLFASAYWALLPLVTRSQIAGGPELYGILLGAIGVGAVIGAFALPWLNQRLGTDWLVALGTLGTALTLVLFGLARAPTTAIVASFIAGMSWMANVSSMSVSAQLALPDWVRGRGLAMFSTVLFGGLTLGSAVWGQVAGMVGLPLAHFVAAAGAVLAIPLTWRWKLQTAAGLDLRPSMHWPTPTLAGEIEPDRGPVLVTVEYRIDPVQRAPFLLALERVARQRRRDGAYAWGVFEDAAVPGRFLETFLVESWLEHLRQHERVTHADRRLQDAVQQFQKGVPEVTHFLAARSGEQS
jgi:MFS family permease